MLDLHRLRVLRTVVATGSVGSAAAALGYTPSAISQQLTVLQRETGLRLVERRGRGIETTAAARTLAEEAGRVLASMGAVECLVGDLRAGRAGSLSISYFASAGAAWIPPVVAELIQEFPDLRLDLRLAELHADSDAAADVMVLVAPPSASPDEVGHPGYVLSHLLNDPYVAVVPQDHPAARRPQVELAELAHDRWVDNDFSRGTCRQVLLDACAEAGFVPDFRIETHDYRTAVSFVAAGLGLTVLPALGSEQLPAGVVAVPVTNPVPVRQILVAVRAAAEHHPAAVRAVALLRRRAGSG